MRKHWLFTSILAAVVVCRAAIVYSQTADEIVEKHLAAMGGRAALAKITSRVTTGTISVSTPGGDLSGSIEVYNKVPNKSRTLVKIDGSQLGIGQIVQDQRFDGTSGYVIDSLNGNREMTGDQLDAARASTFPSPLMKYKDEGSKVEMLGREKAGDRDAYVLKLTPKAGPSARLFIDAETYVLARTVITVNVPQVGADVEQTVNVSDYHDVDGVKVPFQIRSSNQFQTISVMTTKVEHNTSIDDAMFSKPH
jgi:outer membrane lipoprotein-sorting protein